MAKERERRICKVGLVLSIVGLSLSIAHLFVNNILLVYAALGLLALVVVCGVLLHKLRKGSSKKEARE